MDWRLDIEYDGSNFRGWARQEGSRTVQGAIERALRVSLRDEGIEVTVSRRSMLARPSSAPTQSMATA